MYVVGGKWLLNRRKNITEQTDLFAYFLNNWPLPINPLGLIIAPVFFVFLLRSRVKLSIVISYCCFFLAGAALSHWYLLSEFTHLNPTEKYYLEAVIYTTVAFFGLLGIIITICSICFYLADKLLLILSVLTFGLLIPWKSDWYYLGYAMFCFVAPFVKLFTIKINVSS